VEADVYTSYSVLTYSQQLSLYELAEDAARNGSESAMEILIKLPDRRSPCKVGWLFDYESNSEEENLSCRWAFRSAHNINDALVTSEEKRRKIEHMIMPM
jgi:hypothetical protein